jgi:hypothetical protein
MEMTLNFGAGQDGLLNEIAKNAGVTPHEVLRAAFFHFTSTDASSEFEANPRSLKFRFPTEEEEALLQKVSVEASWRPESMSQQDQEALKRASFRVVIK